MSAAFVAAAVAVLATLASAAGSHVISGTADNWATTVADEPLVMVEFFAPWCGHCKTLAPKYEAAAEQLHGSIPLVSVDCTAENDLCSQYEVRGYPTVKVFRNNIPSDYQGARETDAIVRYLAKLNQPAITELNAETFGDFIHSDKVVVVAFLNSLASSQYEDFKLIAEQHKNDYSFAAIVDAAIAAQEGVSGNQVVLYKTFDEGKVVFSGDFDPLAIADFIQAYSVPTMDDIGPDNYSKYADSGIPLAYLFVASDEQRKTYGPAVESVAKQFKGKVNFVYIDANKFSGHAGNLNLKQEWPAFAIQKPKENLKFPYDQSNPITESGIRSFVQDFVNGQITPSVKTEEVPASQDGPVTIVVGCGHCKKLAPIYDELGAKLKPFADHIVIAKMDATLNDLPEDTPYQVSGFPTIKLVKADNTVLDYNGERTVDDFVTFLQTNAVHGSKIDFSKVGNGGSEHAHSHDHDHEEL